MYSNDRPGERSGRRARARRRRAPRGGRASRELDPGDVLCLARAVGGGYHENFETLEQFEQFVDAYPSAPIGLFTNCDDNAARAALRQLKDRDQRCRQRRGSVRWRARCSATSTCPPGTSRSTRIRW